MNWKNWMKKGLSIAGIAFLLTGCSSATQVSSGNADAGDTVKIGGNFELSGATSGYGSNQADGVRLAVKEINDNGGINGKQIEYIEYDNKSNTEEATNMTSRLADQDNVSVVLGPTTSGLFKATIPTGNNSKTPLIAPAAAADNLTLQDDGSVQPYIFRAGFLDSFESYALAKYSDEQGWKKAAILKDNSTENGQIAASEFSKEFQGLGGEIVSDESYSSGDTDFQSVLTNIKDQDPDVIFVGGYYQEGGSIIKQAREMGIDSAIMGHAGFGNQKLVDLAQPQNMNNVLFTSHYDVNDKSNETNQHFVEAFNQEYGHDPDQFAALGYDATYMVKQAMEDCGSANREEVTEALANLKDFHGVTGTFSMDDHHNPIKPAYVEKYENGQIVETTKVDPKEQ